MTQIDQTLQVGKFYNTWMIIVLLFVLLTGCASQPDAIEPMPRSDDYRVKNKPLQFKPIDIETMTKARNYQQKTDQVIIITADERLNKKKGQKNSINSLYTTTLKNIKASLPKKIVYELDIKEYDLEGSTSLLNVIKSINDEKNINEHTAIILLTDWSRVTEEVKKSMHKLLLKHNKPCLYTIGVANIYKNMQLNPIGSCGDSISSESVGTPNRMANFIKNIFYSEPMDTDGDGIYDYKDQCPNTKAYTIITWNGCPRDSSRSNPRYIINQ